MFITRQASNTEPRVVLKPFFIKLVLKVLLFTDCLVANTNVLPWHKPRREGYVVTYH